MHVQCQKISITIKTFHQNKILLDTRIREHHQRTYNTGPVTKTQQCQNMNIESWLGHNLQVNFAAKSYNTGPVTKTQQCRNMNIESWLGRNLQVNFAAKALLQKHVYVFYHFNC